MDKRGCGVGRGRLGAALLLGLLVLGWHRPVRGQTNEELLQELRQLREEVRRRRETLQLELAELEKQEMAVAQRKVLLEEINVLRAELGKPAAEDGVRAADQATDSAAVAMPLEPALPAPTPTAPEAPAMALEPPLPPVGERAMLMGESRQGVEFGAVYTAEGVRNLAGGIARKGAYLDNIDLSAEFDLERIFGWENTTLFVYGLGNKGGDPSTFVGDAQATSNIETDDAWKLYEAWMEKVWGEDRMALRVGLYDLNSEFDVKEYGGTLLNSSHGIGPDFSQSGANGPSIFATAALGARLRLQLTPAYYLQAVVLDGVPGDPNDPTGTHIELSGDEGALVALEAGRVVGGDEYSYGKWGAGIWGYTARFPAIDELDAQGNPRLRRGNVGVYAFGETELMREGDHEQGAGVYGRIGLANPKINQFGLFAGAGLTYTGPGSRAADQLALGVATVVNGGNYTDVTPGAESAETNIELTYRLQLAPWLAVQPDLQYIVNPGTDPGLDNAAVLACRVETAF